MVMGPIELRRVQPTRIHAQLRCEQVVAALDHINPHASGSGCQCGDRSSHAATGDDETLGRADQGRLRITQGFDQQLRSQHLIADASGPQPAQFKLVFANPVESQNLGKLHGRTVYVRRLG